MSFLNTASKLISVKAIVAISLTAGFLVQAIRGQLTEQYMNVYLVVISFYFGTHYQKDVDERVSEVLSR